LKGTKKGPKSPRGKRGGENNQGPETRASEGKTVWDDMIHTLSNRHLDYSIIDINTQ